MQRMEQRFSSLTMAADEQTQIQSKVAVPSFGQELHNVSASGALRQRFSAQSRVSAPN